GLSLEGELDPAQRNRLEIALNAGESLLGLLNDILDISKVEAGKLSLENIPFSVRHLAEECATLHAQQARRKKIQLVSDVDPNLPEHFLGDPTRLRQVLNNLVSNAIKFTDDGSVKIRVGHSGGSLRIDVIDTGIGMSREGLHRIFSPFSQADADTTRLYGGTGLGLTLCRQLVERMHGQILVDSKEGAGTHFTVTLPLPVQDPETGPAPLPIDPSLKAMGIAMAIPPDNPHRPGIEALLRHWGIPIRGASRHQDGLLLAMATAKDTEALAFAENWPGPGVILADDSGTLSPASHQYQLLSLPLRREDLYRCLNRAAGLAEADVESSTDTQALEAPDGGGALSILLVEDNQVNQMVASSLLKKLGHETDHAENGLKAIEALAAKRYDLVLMDCQMPVMDGYEATRRIRENPEWKELPIIAVTANVMQGDREDCLASGMNDYITKPYRREELREAINRWRPEPQSSHPDAP
ncbi:MAG: ATP-binding protein, partial [Pseudomonadota bacterium]|nr:ATP-binding protein [Pseudomonadota bacterium]